MGAAGRMRKQLNKKNAPPPSGGVGLAAQMSDPNQAGEIDPKKEKQVEDVTAMFMKLIHGKETSKSVINALKANPDPAKAVPETANMLMDKVSAQAKKRRTIIPDDIKIAAAQYIVADLSLLGNKAQLWERQVDREEIPQLLQDTVQAYIIKGVKNKTIDPIKLQGETEQLMTPEQKEKAIAMGGEGLPPGPTPAMAVNQHVESAVSKERAKTEQAQAQSQALQGNANQARAAKHDSEVSALAGQ